MPWNEWIARVQFADLDNPSDKVRESRYVVGYSDWTDKTATVEKGQSYPLSIYMGLAYGTYATNLFSRVWIDFNQNGVFEKNEKVLEQNNFNSTVTQSVTIPTTASTGATRMRVSMRKDVYPSVCDVESVFVAGEVEDYTVNIIPSASCANDVTPPVFQNCPSAVRFTTPTNSAVATWQPIIATDNCMSPPSVSSNFSSGQEFPIGTTNVVYTATDARNNQATCRFDVVISPKAAVGDVELSIESSTPTYKLGYAFFIKITAKNIGSQSFTNVRVRFKTPTPSFLFNTTLQFGCTDELGCQEWTIPSLAPNATAVLDMRQLIFSGNEPIIATAKVVGATPEDPNDPNNFASVTINSANNPVGTFGNGFGGFLAQQKPVQRVAIVVNKLAPNPTDGEFYIHLESLDEREVAFTFSNAFGQPVLFEKRKVDKGVQRLEFDVRHLPQGAYVIQVSSNDLRHAPLTFLKF